LASKFRRLCSPAPTRSSNNDRKFKARGF
jgi:hypothetical protein